MTDTAILFISMLLFVLAYELIRRSAMRHIMEKEDADESCRCRRKLIYHLPIGDMC